MANIRFFKTFVAISQHGTFSGAAEKIGLTQSAVSLQMNALEQDLRHPLFDRSSRVAKLNSFGQSILPQVERLIKLYDEIRVASAGAGDIAGSINVGSLISMMGEVSSVIAKLKLTHPRLNVHLATDKSNELNRRAETGEFDLVISVRSSAYARSQLMWTPLYSEPMVLLAHRSSRGQSMEGIIKEKHFLRFDKTQQTGILINRALQKLGIKTNDFLEINSLEAIVELVRQGVGVSILPFVRNATWTSDPSLHVAPLPSVSISRTIGILERRESEQQQIVSLIRDYLINAPRD
ncbi:LysR family transcriptional regulator [Bosea sp. F3-2]|uniref:LysR family transcriptional regulator n=1 Tax=Bosea sp. F3-2 TaxID=2599640 RepID=UPI00165546E5|nr:LysR family transcriptional regulator [Bosea sp. F3-2]